MRMFIIFSILLYFILTISGFAHLIEGFVFQDENGNGVRDIGEVGLANIGVSNGLEIVITDANGKYRLTIDTAAQFVFITVPSGYISSSSFYYVFAEDNLRTEYNFGLQKMVGKPSDYFIQVTDIHIDTTLATGADFKSVIHELNQLNPPPAFIIATGDLVSRGSYTTQYELYIDGVKQSRAKWYHVFGNHDANDGDNRVFNYHHYLGPDYYSFDYNGYHCIVLNSVLTTFRQQRWFDKDVKILGTNKPILVFQHYPPQPDLRHNPIAKYPEVTALFTGHWHSDKIWFENNQLYISTPPLRFGGIDASPAGYRIIKIQNQKSKILNKKDRPWLTTEYRFIGQRRSIVSPVLIEDIGAVSQPTTDWLTFKKDNVRIGTSENVLTTPPLALCWKTELKNSQVMLSSPVIKDKMLYLAVKNKSGTGGRIIAINAISGKQIRSAPTRLPVNHTPAISNDMLYATDMGGRIYAFSLPNLQLQWSYDLDDGFSHWIYSAPVVAGNRLYTGNAGKFVCLDAIAGSLIWEKKYGSDWVSSWTTPSVANDTLYFGAIWNEKNCCAIDAQTGEIIWSYKCSGLHTAPVVYNGKIYIADIDGNLTAIDSNSGQKRWSFAMDKSWSLTTPSIAYGLVVSASGKGTVYALDAETGQLHWQFRTNDSLLRMSPYQPNYATIFSSPVISGKTVYIGASDGNFYALDINSGNLVWKQDFDIPILSTPAISGNTLYLASMDGVLYAFCSRQ
ncbi:MAG: PQQ-binding-like beta-propeller repeat protein [bacterium]|nr:PQQ-binding-like beta-propeller repeat protein [bacterium]